jgi:hypothetical protein
MTENHLCLRSRAKPTTQNSQPITLCVIRGLNPRESVFLFVTLAVGVIGKEAPYDTSNMRFLRSLGRLSRLRPPSIGRKDKLSFLWTRLIFTQSTPHPVKICEIRGLISARIHSNPCNQRSIRNLYVTFSLMSK